MNILSRIVGASGYRVKHFDVNPFLQINMAKMQCNKPKETTNYKKSLANPCVDLRILLRCPCQSHYPLVLEVVNIHGRFFPIWEVVIDLMSPNIPLAWEDPMIYLCRPVFTIIVGKEVNFPTNEELVNLLFIINDVN